MKKILAVLLIIAFCHSCMSHGTFDPQSDPVAKIEGEEIVMIVEVAMIVKSVKSADINIEAVHNVRIESENGFHYLMFDVETSPYEVIPYAVQLIPVKTGSSLLLAAGTTHSCKGHCCESCRFNKAPSGEITGCWCQRAAATPGCQTDARCDHSISTNSSVILH
ncbi:MAG: hypothetical protein R6W71_05150 [Bacteroidales bacterium]|jgi:hypothetical protein